MILVLNFACTDRSSRTRILKVKLAMCVISDSVIDSAVAQFSNSENATASSTAVDPVWWFSNSSLLSLRLLDPLPSAPSSVSLGRAAATGGAGRGSEAAPRRWGPRGRGPGGGGPLTAHPKAELLASGVRRGGGPGRSRVGRRRRRTLTSEAREGARRPGRGLAHAQKRTSASGLCAAHGVRDGPQELGNKVHGRRERRDGVRFQTEWRTSVSSRERRGWILGPDQRSSWGWTELGGTSSACSELFLARWETQMRKNGCSIGDNLITAYHLCKHSLTIEMEQEALRTKERRILQGVCSAEPWAERSRVEQP
nr:PREDICTED: uncharacterized protein LOC109456203 [Rhinolophus sinicus]